MSRLTLRIIVVLGAAVVLAGAATAAPPAPSPLGVKCTPAAAKKAILAAPALKSLRLYLAKGSGGGVDRLICHDLTRDGKTDMAATIFSGGTAGDIAWVAFRQVKGRWVLGLRELDRYQVGLFLLGNDLADTQPVFLKNDPNCCPTGGYDHRRFHWNGKRFVQVRFWHDKHIRP